MILNRINNQLEVEITFTFGLAYLVFYIADVELGVSAVLALVTMGLYMNKYRYCISSNVQPIMSSAWRITTYFINILIFTVTGIVLAHSFIGTATSISSRDFGYSVLLYLAIHVGRVLPIVVLHPWMKWNGCQSELERLFRSLVEWPSWKYVVDSRADRQFRRSNRSGHSRSIPVSCFHDCSSHSDHQWNDQSVLCQSLRIESR